MTQRIKCQQCDAMILPATAEFTGGICMPCHKSITSPPLEPEEEDPIVERVFQEGLDIDVAVRSFLDMGRAITEADGVTGMDVLSRIVDWYRQSRVARTVLDEDGDMLLLEWGATTPMILDKPADLRDADGTRPQFAKSRHRYLGFTRQVWPRGEEEDEEFDGLAVAMCITLAYELSDDSEPSGNAWIQNPEAIDEGINTFMNPYVSQLIAKTPIRVSVFSSHVG